MIQTKGHIILFLSLHADVDIWSQNNKYLNCGFKGETHLRIASDL